MAKNNNSSFTFQKLFSAKGEKLAAMPWNEYPRPMMRRDSFFCLNGKWNFCVKNALDEVVFDGEITVPFAPESMLSGVDRVFPEECSFVYRKKFVLPNGFQKERVLLHFGGVDQTAKVYLNGNFVTEHVGGYLPFHADIAPYLKEENLLTVEVTDNLSQLMLPYGKQSRNRGGMWYTPVSGIWQTVWLESVPKEYISHIETQVKDGKVRFEVHGVQEATVTVFLPTGEEKLQIKKGEATLKLDSPVAWSPENPYLYDYCVESENDKVQSYFAVRTLSVKKINGIQRLCLNGEPYFFHGLLDQGYFSDGLFTPATPQMYETEIKKIKALGFNTLRKHIKIEPQLFYYACDRLGMVVWQDMVNNGEYNFIRDTALPTAGFIRRRDKGMHKNKLQREIFIYTMQKTVELLQTHPAICCWTIFNEGWGQFESEKMYKLLKSWDDTRFIDATSGWFQCGDSDLDSRHIYFHKIKVKPAKKPVVLSEFGGCVYAVPNHVFNTLKPYGYGKCRTREEFVKKIRTLYQSEIIPAAKNGLCASIYTQVSDIEDEINGLFTYDRKVDKIKPEEFADISALLIASVKDAN